MTSSGEIAYRQLLQDCLECGEDDYNERTGIGTRRVFGRMIRFDLSEGRTALLTSKRIPYSLPYREKLWMISGQTNIRPLLLNGVTIWSDWPHDTYVKKTGSNIPLKEFEQRIIDDLDFAEQWGDLGPVYGAQWRRWKAYRDVLPSEAIVHRLSQRNNTDFRPPIIAKHMENIDQLQLAIDLLMNAPSSRRILVNAWNPADIGEMALPPCHYGYQFSKMPSGHLDLLVNQRKQ